MKKHFYRNIGFLALLFFSALLFSSFSSAQESVDLSLKRTFGMAFGGNIQGTFTVIGSGSENIINLSLQFNDIEVANSDSNSLSFRFKTKDYEPGELNITLSGYDIGEIKYSMTKLVKIMTPTISIIITVVIFLVVAGAFTWKYGPRIRNYFRTKRDINRKEDPID